MTANPASPAATDLLRSLTVQTLVSGGLETKQPFVHEKSVDATILAATVRGRYEVSHSGRTWMVHPGEMFVVPRCTPVRIVHHLDRRGVMQAKWVHLHLSLYGSIDVLGLYEFPGRLTRGQSPPILAAIDQLQAMGRSQAAGVDLPGVLNRHRLAGELALHLFALGRYMPERTGAWRDTSRLLLVFQMVSQSLHRPITIRDLCNWAHLSPSRLHAVFLKATGQPPLRHVLQMRLEQARRQLIYTDQPIQQISQSLAFASPFHFSRTFKRVVGISPKSYRTANRAG